jgi:hypothetical protein
MKRVPYLQENSPNYNGSLQVSQFKYVSFPFTNNSLRIRQGRRVYGRRSRFGVRRIVATVIFVDEPV